MIASHSDRCDDLASPDITNFGVSLFVITGIFVSYLPQHYKLIARRSSAGLSPFFVLLGQISTTYAFANILTLPVSREDMSCCGELSGFECFAAVLGILQLGVQFACFTFILLLFLLFFPRASPLEPSTDPSEQPSCKTAVMVTTVCGINALLTLIVSFLVIHLAPGSLQGYASALGVAGTVLAGAQYFPQIFTTWRRKSVGSLSIPMMCIQTPGSFVFAGNLAARLGWAGWSTWGLFIFTGILQGTVLAMGISFMIRDRRKRKEMENGGVGNGHVVGGEEDEEDQSEETPLLGDR